MANPKAATTSNTGRFYTWTRGDEEHQVPSVTTILSDGIPKPALVNWGPKMCAEFTADNLDTLNALAGQKNGKAMIVDLVKRSPYREKDIAAGMGTGLHDYAEARANGHQRIKSVDGMFEFLTQLWGEDGRGTAPSFEFAERVLRFADSFELFLDEWRPSFLRTEASVFNLRYEYAGTLDFIVEIDGRPLGFAGTVNALGDYKSSKPGKQGHGIYPETALQLAAYRHAEFIGEHNGTETEMPEVDCSIAVNIRPDRYSVVPVRSGAEVFRSFLYVAQVARFQKQGADLVGAPMAPPVHDLGLAA